ncbi:hypothetical protein Celaphus_00002575 [Cervus elaphus hippelaphus]|uniref:Uncharacterized protein n=1 Tax=Cervus elaphus hippelaphus TaxID=46360 RepID=A0A212CHX2_CEREH|nr:hypothetical protein Celaphus_00002575 [Cervus elaphus hippelaphus]
MWLHRLYMNHLSGDQAFKESVWMGGEILQTGCSGKINHSQGESATQSHCTMSVSALSPTREALGSVSGLLQVLSLLGLVLLLLKATQFYLHRRWLLKALRQFPSASSHWFYRHKQEVGWSWTRDWEGREGWGSRARSWSVSPWDRGLLCDQHMTP